MSNFNRVLLMGNLTRDPQVKNLPNSGVVVEFGLATSRRYRTAAGEDREETAFVDCSAFGRQAEVISQFCRKGKPLFVEGRLKYDTWDDKQTGAKRSKLSVVVENFQFLGNAGGSSPGTVDESGGERSKSARTGQEAFPGEAPPRRKKAAELPFGEETHFEEADIPF
jgi:single-strand DNA-binding protein